MSSKKVFSLQGKGLKLTTKEDIEPHLKELRSMPEVEEIHIGGNTLGAPACQALAEVIKDLKHLRVADYADIFTGRLIDEIPTAIGALTDALIHSTSIREVDLSDNAYGPRCAPSLVPFLSQNTHFTILKLSNNGLGPEGSTIIAEALEANAKNARRAAARTAMGARMMGSVNPLDNQATMQNNEPFKSNLRVFHCGRNRMQMESMAAWGKTFAAHGGLQEVRLYQNGIFEAGFPPLIAGLSACPDLQYLDLADNTINKQGCAAIARALPCWPQLTILNLSESYLTNAGATAIFNVLKTGTSPKLTSLQLQFSEIGEKAMMVLAQAILDHGANITSLSLNGNIAKAEGKAVQEVMDALDAHGHSDALDELEEMEEPEEEEEEEEAEERLLDEVGEDEQTLREKLKEGAKDASVDELAEALGKTSI
ncbi:SubName: Full=Probable ran GTPase activating protein 1 {ECO:0000313/EMBL:CCA67638.1} [Serendipita indica DSM 11827]|uniref:Probable ran GTPase activating protein 1 n=1 Tax=Serendipita indica (strain DSM 11827) TaxID=1109443 RepID=G4T8J0_SERID|nr:SubName: Full=Probable ran GTPase activating protein 1 {ECO:0000313/EMBL:CCA67638.1} [Serendipita indica DSM 11827]CCA67638.1 probable ran GTPase activating protein 1 [Serendipita indica DSM 11827]